ncbi:MAG: hypothetical protein WD851_04725 [Pirellulales bacterium]
MDKLLSQVRRARQRLVLEQFLSRLVGCLFGTLLVAAVAIAVPKVIVLENLPAWWANAWLGSAAAAGVIAAGVWTLAARRTSLDAAMEIDRRFELRERVASSLSLDADDRESEAGQALVSDAVRAISRIEVRDKFGIGIDRRAWLPLVPATLAFCLASFVGNREANSNVPAQQTQIVAKQVKKSAEELRKKIAERAKEAEKKDLKDATHLLKEIEKGTKDLANKASVDQKDAAVKLNDLAKQLEQRRSQLGSRETLEKQLGNKDFGKGPGEKLAEAMKQGDWQKAQQELEKLQQELTKGGLDPAAQKQLGEQLSKMQQKLAESAKAHQQAIEQLQKQVDQQRQQGNQEQAAKLQQKLDQLAQQQPQMKHLEQLAQQMGECQACMKAGDQQGAQQALDGLAQQMQQMQMNADEMAMLDEAMQQIEMAKQSMACAQCQGAGCQACQGKLASSKAGQGDKQGGENGPGIGKGSGPGRMPEDLEKTGFRDSQVRQNAQKGAMTFGGLVDGPNIAGVAAEQIKAEMTTEAAEPADPLTSERLPRSRREHAEEYFNKLREGK